MKKFNIKDFELELHHIVVACTTMPDYEMGRKILLDIGCEDYVLVEGWHCSCYGFDETEWDAISYTREELEKLATAPYNQDSDFWAQVREQL